jgi:Ca2+-binding EF-hand superfamily protein
MANLRAQNVIGQFDRNRGGYLDRSEAVDRPGSEFRPEQFPLWDQDGDGLIFRFELEAVFQREVSLSRCWMRIELVRHSPPLWRNADANDDSMLGAREIRNLVRQLSEYDADGNGEVAYHEMPFEMGVSIGRGTLVRYLSSRHIARPAPTTSATAPAWFMRMDVNRDGDVSPREFLGTLEQFQRTDADHDGLIDPREAQAATP